MTRPKGVKNKAWKKSEYEPGIAKNQSGNFQVKFARKGTHYYLGTFHTLEEASYVLRQAKKAYEKGQDPLEFRQGSIRFKIKDFLLTHELDFTLDGDTYEEMEDFMWELYQSGYRRGKREYKETEGLQ